MKKNTVRLFAIIAIIIVVAGITLYYESSGTTNNQSNSESKPGSIVYPTGNLAGAIEISHLDGVSGSNELSFNIPNGTMCLVFLMYTNNSVACVSAYNSTGGYQANLNNNVASIHFEGQRVPYYSPLTGSYTQKWHIFYNVHLESAGNFNFKIFAANFLLK